MRKYLLTGAALLALSAANLWAEDTLEPALTPASGGMAKQGRMQNMSLDQVKQFAHKRMEKLDTMTEEEWANNPRNKKGMTLAQARADAQKRIAKIDSLTPEQWDKFKTKRAQGGGRGGAAGGFGAGEE